MKKKCYTFMFSIPAGSNFVPSSKIHEHAKKLGYKETSWYDNTLLWVKGIPYSFERFRLYSKNEKTEIWEIIMMEVTDLA